MKHENIEGIIIPRPQSFGDCLELIRSDFYRTFGRRINSPVAIWVAHFHDPGHRFLFYFRLCSYMPKSFFKKAIRRVFVWRLIHNSRKYGIQVPYPTRIGYGLKLNHYLGVLINENAIIGNNVTFSHFNSIAADDITAGRIEDNSFFGPHACTVGGVRVGKNSLIGVGSVVTKSIPEFATAAGVPAKVLHTNAPYTPRNPWPIPFTE